MRLGVSLGLAVLVVACTGSASVSPSPSAAPSTAAPSESASVQPSPSAAAVLQFSTETFAVPGGTHPHDVAPAVDGGVWYTAQHTGRLGWLDPETGDYREIPLGDGSAPHGVIVGPDDAPWITDGGLNAIVRVDPETDAVTRYPLPAVAAQRQPEHRRVRRGRDPVVHRPGRLVRTRQPGHELGRGVGRAPRRGAVRDHGHAGRGDLLRLAGRLVPRGGGHRQRRGDGARATDCRRGRAARMVRLTGPNLDRGVERRPGGGLRPRQRDLARMAPARKRRRRRMRCTWTSSTRCG